MKSKNIIKLIPFLSYKSFFNFSNKKKDLYQILGVNKTATSNQIKKAYYKLAQQHHPDKSTSANAKDKFSEINNAYQVLSDENKRKSYDQTGSMDDNYSGFSEEDIFKNFHSANGFGFRGGNKGQSMHGFQDIFQDLFGEAFASQGQRPKRKSQTQKEDLTVKLDIDFKESVNGTKKSIKYNRITTCGTCKGSKSSPGSKPQKCGMCQGTGYMTMRQGVMMIRTQCQSCNGQGVKITSPCKTCSGNGSLSTENQQEIIIPRGIHDGATLKFKGKGNMNGDLNIKLNIKKHPQFKREGIDSLIQRQISVIDAVLGCQLEIVNIYEEKKKVKIPSGTQNEQKIKVNRDGFYKINSNEKGSMIITVKVKMPSKLSEEQKSLYEQLRKVSRQSK